MPDKTGRLTPQEDRFVDRYVATGDAVYSAEKAGYGSPAARASQNLAKAAIQSEIRARQTERLWGDVLPLAIGELERGLREPTTPWGAKSALIKLAMDRTLGASDAAEGKQPHEMTPDELARAIEQLKREASDRAKPIEVVEVEESATTNGLFS